MEAILANPVALTVLPPLLAGLLLGLLAWVSAGNRVVMAIGWSAGILFVYWLLEGVPPLPPIAAKQKLGYLLLFGGALGVLLSMLPLVGAGRLWPIMAAALVAAFVWLGFNTLNSGVMSGEVSFAFLPTILLIVVLLGRGLMESGRVAIAERGVPPTEQPFIIPIAWLATAIAGSISAAAGLFLGMAQMLGALAALTGGALMISHIALIAMGEGLRLMEPGAAFALGFAIACALLLTALLAPSANLLSLIVLSLSVPLTGYGRARIAALPPTMPALRPIIAGAIIAVPAVIACIVAMLTGGNPFA